MPEPLMLERSLSAVTELLDFLEVQLGQHKIDKDTIADVELAADELFSNMVRHNSGGGDSITFELGVTDRKVEFRLIDRDVEPFEPAEVPAPVKGLKGLARRFLHRVFPRRFPGAALAAPFDLPPEKRRPGGLGLFLARNAVDKITYRHEAGRMIVSAVKSLGT